MASTMDKEFSAVMDRQKLIWAQAANVLGTGKISALLASPPKVRA
jgi:hypothetical protein